MRGKVLENVTLVSQLFMSQVVKAGAICIDATTGNGNDTLYLSNLVGETGKVFGFDVQAVAIENTREKLLLEGQYDNCQLFLQGHENMAEYIHQPIDFIIFNLGYLPRADKAVKTKESTTLPAIDSALDLLKPFGILWLVIYPGHDEGAIESSAIQNYLSGLDQKKYCVMRSQFINQANTPPYMIGVEKKV